MHVYPVWRYDLWHTILCNTPYIVLCPPGPDAGVKVFLSPGVWEHSGLHDTGEWWGAFLLLLSLVFFSLSCAFFLISAGGWWATHSGICQNDAKGSTHWNAANSSQMVSGITFIYLLLSCIICTFCLFDLFSCSSLTYMCRASAIRTDDSCIVLKVRFFPHVLVPRFIVSLVILYQWHFFFVFSPLNVTFCCLCRPCHVSCECAVKSICSRKGWRVQRHWRISWSPMWSCRGSQAPLITSWPC